MTTSDAQIARKWVEAWVEEPTNDMLAAVYRHILATTAPPTMANVEWDSEVHTGMCAEFFDGDVVLMIGPDLDNEDDIICHWIHYGSPVTERLPAEKLTPIPGTKIDLTPRRESTTPDHPEVLATEEEYESAPVGTVVEYDDDVAVKRNNGQWQWTGRPSRFWSEDLAEGDPCTVVRWGK